MVKSKVIRNLRSRIQRKTVAELTLKLNNAYSDIEKYSSLNRGLEARCRGLEQQVLNLETNQEEKGELHFKISKLENDLKVSMQAASRWRSIALNFQTAASLLTSDLK